jgi:hypothetical protein
MLRSDCILTIRLLPYCACLSIGGCLSVGTCVPIDTIRHCLVIVVQSKTGRDRALFGARVKVYNRKVRSQSMYNIQFVR